MAFKYNPPTRTECSVCEELRLTNGEPIIDTQEGKASKANDFPVHNWYNFVLGYTPEFPNYMFEREGIKKGDLVVDPFMGSGTTLVCAKYLGVESAGIDANDFMAYAGSVKLNWNRNISDLKNEKVVLMDEIQAVFNEFDWDEVKTESGEDLTEQISIFNMDAPTKKSYIRYAELHRPKMLVEKYMCDKPFVKAHLIKKTINEVITKQNKELFRFALSSILVPISNVSYGPGFGVKKPKGDIDVYKLYNEKLNRMISDLESLNKSQIDTKSSIRLGDSRQLSNYFEDDSVSIIITSPPYPGDHEYTKHTRLELIFDDLANDLAEFRVIKKRMIRGSTTNIYKDDFDRENVLKFNSIQNVTDLIQSRLDEDGATSGFEKLYTKLIWEYFGGMYKTLSEAYKVLKPGGKIALLVSDSHAFKMVHIQTAKILEELGLDIGYSDSEILLWQFKKSTSHKYDIREDILILTK